MKGHGTGLARIEKAGIFFLTLFSFCLPLHQKWSTIILFILVIISLPLKKKRVNYWNLSFFLPPLLYVLMAISLLYSENLDLRFLEHRASLLAFPIIYSAMDLTRRKQLQLFNAFIYGCASAVLICYGNAIFNSFSILDGSVVFKPVINDEFSFMYSVIRDGNYFFSSHFSIFHQSTYFAFYLNVAIAIILAFSMWKKNKIFFALLFIFPLVVFQLSSKINLLICGLVFVVYGVRRINSTFARSVFIVIILVITSLLIVKNPRTKVLLDTTLEKGLKIEPSERYGYTLRLMSWDAAVSVILSHPIVGVGIGDTQMELNKVYMAKGYEQPLKEELNAHNQFLQITLACGILGLLVLICMLREIYRKLKLCSDTGMAFFYYSFLFVITLNFLFESYLNRYSGISCFGFFYYLLIRNDKKSKVDDD